MLQLMHILSEKLCIHIATASVWLQKSKCTKGIQRVASPKKSLSTAIVVDSFSHFHILSGGTGL